MMAIPIGMKMTPTAAKSAMTIRGVKIGRHALSVCCLKAESADNCTVGRSERA